MNKLVFKDSKVNGGEKIIVTIELADDCHNGHQDFSVTASIYDSKGLNVGGGCCHDVINTVFDGKYKDFCDLHLCDWQGYPVYAVENGFYHIKNVGQSTFLEYYPGVTPSQYKKLVKAEDQTGYAILLQDTGVVATWQAAAKKAVTRLEELTGQKFECDSVKSNFHAPTDKQIAEYRERVKSGYYTAKAIKARKIAAAKKADSDKIAELHKTYSQNVAKAKTDLEIELLVIRKLGVSALDATIFYAHTNTVVFNWYKDDYTRLITREEYDKFLTSLTRADYKRLPEGIKFELK